MHRFLQPVLPQKRPEKRCRQWCRGARIGAIQFSSYCHSFPLFALLEPGDRATDTGNTEVHKRKETPRQPRGFVEKHCVLKRSAEAERQGFEPWVPVRALRFSRPVQSAALPSLRGGCYAPKAGLSTSFQTGGLQMQQSGKTDPYNCLPRITHGPSPNQRTHPAQLTRFSKFPAPPHQKYPSNETDDPETETSAAHDQYPADAVSSPADRVHAPHAPPH